jgi:FlaA1/EpsC-like NDP-sugar epimerase
MSLKKWITTIIFDSFLCLGTVWFSYYLRVGVFYHIYDIEIIPIIASIIILLSSFTIFSIYYSFIRYSGLDTFLQLGKALLIYSIIFSIIFTFIGIEGVPRTLGIIQPIFLSLLIFISRALVRYILSTIEQISNKHVKQNLLIYGAGTAGRQIGDIINRNPNMNLLGFIDDNKNLQGNRINNKKIYSISELLQIKKKKKIDYIFISIPSLNKNKHSKILANLQKFLIPVKTLPNINQLIDGKINLSNFKTPHFNDLLGRDIIVNNHTIPNKTITGKIVLISGGGGSIGSEICRQIYQLEPDKILILELNEYALYKIKQELEIFNKNKKKFPQILCFLGSVDDNFVVENIMLDFKPNIIFHAAAYKHVNLVEDNPISGLQNNLFGTITLAKSAIKHKVSHFILVSTDKAVRSTNIMGASKRLAEMSLLALNKKTKNTKFSIVRFGNVLGSSGSVIPKFYQQILEGGPITLTHPDVKRFFMTIGEAVQLVIETAKISKGGEIFILDMGKLVKIKDLAERLINLSGKTIKNIDNPMGDIEIKITGLLPGEKLYEEVLIKNNAKKTSNPKILKATESSLDWIKLSKQISLIKTYMLKSNISNIKKLLLKLDTGYQQTDKTNNQKYS